MLIALFILTFVTGFFLGALALVAVCTYMINRGRNRYMEAIDRGRKLAQDQMAQPVKHPFN